MQNLICIRSTMVSKDFQGYKMQYILNLAQETFCLENIPLKEKKNVKKIRWTFKLRNNLVTFD